MCQSMANFQLLNRMNIFEHSVLTMLKCVILFYQCWSKYYLNLLGMTSVTTCLGYCNVASHEFHYTNTACTIYMGTCCKLGKQMATMHVLHNG